VGLTLLEPTMALARLNVQADVFLARGCAEIAPDGVFAASVACAPANEIPAVGRQFGAAFAIGGAWRKGQITRCKAGIPSSVTRAMARPASFQVAAFKIPCEVKKALAFRVASDNSSDRMA